MPVTEAIRTHAFNAFTTRIGEAEKDIYSAITLSREVKDNYQVTDVCSALWMYGRMYLRKQLNRALSDNALTETQKDHIGHLVETILRETDI